MTGPVAPVADVPSAFVDAVATAFAARSGASFVMVLSGGPTARACYQRLAEACQAPNSSIIDWSVVEVYMGDERVVPPDDPDANQRLVRESLLDHVPPVASFTPMPTEGAIEACVAAYQGVMARLLGPGGPGIDLIHLGMGPDGHTASLFPGAPTLQAGPDVLVAATEDPNGRNPHPRLTVTLPVINAARRAVFTVSGDSKFNAVAQLRAGAVLPAAEVQSAEVIWLVDRAAFGEVSGEGPGEAASRGSGSDDGHAP
jgi:6-phosphogluconolactonase